MSEILIWPFRQVFRLLAPIKAAWNEELSKHYYGPTAIQHKRRIVMPQRQAEWLDANRPDLTQVHANIEGERAP